MARHKREQEYTVGSWHGLDNYCCLSCPFATLDREAIERHVAEQHRSKPRPARRYGGKH
jgi:hypothetical protein